MYDAAIVGAGPSGSICAYRLAKAGFKVLIADKKKFPRAKLCGGGLAYKTTQLLKEVINFDDISPKHITGSYFSFRNDDLVFWANDTSGFIVQRDVLDNAILQSAVRAGCDAETPAEIEEVTESDSHVTLRSGDRKSFEARYLVIAEGVNGRLHTTLGYKGRRETTMALEIDIAPSYIPEGLKNNMLLDFGSIPGGYAWIFPNNNNFNVGAYWCKSGTINDEQRRSLERFAEQFDWSVNGQKSRMKGYPLPYKIDYEHYNTARTMLVGDCAGTVENLFGEGIYYGLTSGLLASDVLKKALTQNLSLNTYSEKMKRELLKQIGYSRFIARHFYAHPNFGYKRMVRNKLINSLFTRLIHGSSVHSSVLFCTLLLFPFSVFSDELKSSPFGDVGLMRK
jgi:geranylgeranyl reductase family protein